MVPRTASPAQYIGVPVTETRDDSVTWLTQEAYDRLKAELDHLSGPGRIDIAKKIEAARDEGDLKRERRVPRGQGRAGPDRGADHPPPAHPGERPRRRAGPHRRRGRPGHDGHDPVRQGRRGGDLPARLPRGERLADRRLLARARRSAPPSSGKKVGEKATYSLPNGRASTVEILEAVPYVGA